jgi:hypothetical protein
MIMAALAAILAGGNAGATSVPTLYFANSFNYTDAAQYPNYVPNGLSASATGSDDGETVFSSVNLATGTLKESNSATPATSTFNTGAEAILGDTITATGAIAGKNLGASIMVNGSTVNSNTADDQTFLVVMALQTGSFDAGSNFFSHVLWGTGYTLGTDSTLNPSFFSFFGVTNAGHYSNGQETIPLGIPFASLGSNFQLYVALDSFMNGNTAADPTWTNDYSHTLSVSLSGPNGVTLNSASGVLPGTSSAVPEPSTSALSVLALLAGAAAIKRSKKRGCGHDLAAKHQRPWLLRP